MKNAIPVKILTLQRWAKESFRYIFNATGIIVEVFILEETRACDVAGAVNTSGDIKQLLTKVKERRGQTPTDALSLESKNKLIQENRPRNKKITKRLTLDSLLENIGSR